MKTIEECRTNISKIRKAIRILENIVDPVVILELEQEVQGYESTIRHLQRTEILIYSPPPWTLSF